MSGFEEHPSWRPPYAANISTLLPLIRKYNEAIQQFARNPANAEFVQGAIEEYRECFITELNRTSDIGGENLTPREIQKRRNIREAIEDLFGNELVADSLRMDFNVNLAKTLNETIGRGLIENAGVYRECDARPRGYSFNYLEPIYIENWLNQLFKDINQPLEPGRDDWYNVATDFFNRFLFAHPFRNGNGRVARILLSALLINYTIVPLCFFLWKSGCNEIYLNVLAEAHDPIKKNDTLLKSFIIEAVHGALEHCVNNLEIQVD